MKKVYIICLILVASINAQSQLPIAYFDFENGSNRTQFENAVDLQVNTGTTALAATNVNMSNQTGAGLFNTGTQSGTALMVNRTSGTPLDPRVAATSYVQFQTNAAGFAGIGLGFDVFANSSAAPFYGVSYSTNGISFTWVGSVQTPGTNNRMPFPNNNTQGAFWDRASCSLPANADNAASLTVRIYFYNNGNNGANSHLRFDNLQVTALGTIAGASKAMIDDRAIYNNVTSGATSSMANMLMSIKRNQFTATGAGTIITVPFLGMTGTNNVAGVINVENNAVLSVSSNNFYVDSARTNVPASVINIRTGGTLRLLNTLECQGNINLEDGVIDVNGQKLILGGNIQRVNGTINVGTGTIELAGKNAAQTISGAMFTNKKIDQLVNNNKFGINISTTANDTLKVTGSIRFGNVNNSVINTGNNLTLTSTETSTAAVADLTNNGVNNNNRIVGKVNVDRFISFGGKWRLVSVPTNSTQTFKQSWQENASTAAANPVAGYGAIIGDNRSNWAANGFDVNTPGGPTVKIYDAATNNYVGISSTNNSIKTDGGYMMYLRGNRSNTISTTTIRTSGELYTGTQPAINVPANQFKVIGNPYAAQVNINNIIMNGLQEVVYVWDPKAGGTYGLGAYQTLIKMGNDYVVFPGGGSYGAQLSVNNTIESGQAFLVRAGAQAGSIQFQESAKQTGSRLVSRNPNANSPMLRATLYTGTSLLDAAMINFEEAFNNAVDADDILKVANGSENVSFKINNNLLVADRRQMPASKDTFRLNLTGLRAQTYKWVINADQLNTNARVAYLLDGYNNSITPLNMNGETEYNFTVINTPASYAANRFVIVTDASETLPVNITSVAASRAVGKQNEVSVIWKVEEEMNMENYEVEYSTDGSSFSSIATIAINSSNNGSGVYSFLNQKATTADHFYRIKANSIGGQVQYSAIVKVAGAKASSNSSISVYPNPVVNKKMNVQFLNQPQGNYQVSLISNNGAIVYKNNVSVNSNNLVKMMPLQSSTPAGNYQLIVTNEAGNTQTQSVIVL